MADRIDYKRILNLSNKIKNNTATNEEKDEYMALLFQNGNITKQQYDNYKSKANSTSNDVLDAALVIGGIVLLGYLLSEAFKK